MKVREVSSFEVTTAALQVSCTSIHLIIHSAYAIRIGQMAGYRMKLLVTRIQPNLRY